MSLVVAEEMLNAQPASVRAPTGQFRNEDVKISMHGHQLEIRAVVAGP